MPTHAEQHNMQSDPSIPPSNGKSPWKKLPMELKGYILWLDYAPDGILRIIKVGFNTMLVVPRIGPCNYRQMKKGTLQEAFAEDLYDETSRRAIFRNHEGRFVDWALDRYVGETWLIFRSLSAYKQLMRRYYQYKPTWTMWMSNATKISLDIPAGDPAEKSKDILGEFAAVLPNIRCLRLCISPSFFRGAYKDITTRIWNAEDVANFFRNTRVTKMHSDATLVVEGVVGGHLSEVFERNLETYRRFLDGDMAGSRHNLRLPTSSSVVAPFSIPPVDGSCPWQTLPRELQDAIFQLAYVPPTNQLNVMTAERWYEIHGEDSGVCLVCRSCVQGTCGWLQDEEPIALTPFIAKFLISRTWFNNSWKLFLAETTLHCAQTDLKSLLPIHGTGDEDLSWTQDITRISLTLTTHNDQVLLKRLEEFPALRHLHLCFHPFFFQKRHNRQDITTVLWTESDYLMCWNVWRPPPTCNITVRAMSHVEIFNLHDIWAKQGRKFGQEYIQITQIFASNVGFYGWLLEVHVRQERVRDEDIPDTLAGVQDLCAINPRGMLEFLREVKRERMERRILGR